MMTRVSSNRPPPLHVPFIAFGLGIVGLMATMAISHGPLKNAALLFVVGLMAIATFNWIRQNYIPPRDKSDRTVGQAAVCGIAIGVVALIFSLLQVLVSWGLITHSLLLRLLG